MRLSRTITGNAASIGQQLAAQKTGATHKIWVAASDAREEHQDRDGQKVEIDGRFSRKFGETVGPRYPLDNRIPPADRVNCRCSMRFTRENS